MYNTDKKVIFPKEFFPSILKIIFNVDEKAEKIEFHTVKNSESGKKEKVKTIIPKHKILTTIIYFDDNTKVVCTNSVGDKIDFDENGDVSYDAKERGLVYALTKKLCGYYDEKNKVITGFSAFLRKIVNNFAILENSKEKTSKTKPTKSSDAKNLKPREISKSIVNEVKKDNNTQFNIDTFFTELISTMKTELKNIFKNV